MIGDLRQIELYFNIDEINKKTLNNFHIKLNSIIDEGKTGSFWKDKEFFEEKILPLQDLVNGDATILERIRRALSIIEYKAVLIKYDLTCNQTNVLAHYKKIETDIMW
jgi:hypothetical protein